MPLESVQTVIDQASSTGKSRQAVASLRAAATDAPSHSRPKV